MLLLDEGKKNCLGQRFKARSKISRCLETTESRPGSKPIFIYFTHTRRHTQSRGLLLLTYHRPAVPIAPRGSDSQLQRQGGRCHNVAPPAHKLLLALGGTRARAPAGASAPPQPPSCAHQHGPWLQRRLLNVPASAPPGNKAEEIAFGATKSIPTPRFWQLASASNTWRCCPHGAVSYLPATRPKEVKQRRWEQLWHKAARLLPGPALGCNVLFGDNTGREQCLQQTPA